MCKIKCLDEAWRKLQIVALFRWLGDACSQFRNGYLERDQNLPWWNLFLQLCQLVEYKLTYLGAATLNKTYY